MPLAVIGNELTASTPLLEALDHCHPNLAVFSRRRIAADIPDDGVVLVALAEEFAKCIGILGVEHPLRMFIDVPRFGDDQTHH